MKEAAGTEAVLEQSVSHAAGLRVFWDRKIHSGENWRQKLDQKLKQAASVLVLWSRSSVNSSYVLDEAEIAQKDNSYIPVRIEEIEIPLGFGQINWFDLFDWDGDRELANFPELFDHLSEFIEQRRARESATGADASPTKIDHLLAKTVDRLHQIGQVERVVAEAGGDRHLFVVQACNADWVSALADHIYLRLNHDWRLSPQQAATYLDLSRPDRHAFRHALGRKIESGGRGEPDPSTVVGWIDKGSGVQVLWVQVEADRQTGVLREWIEGALEYLDGLPAFRPDKKLVVLFACVRAGRIAWRPTNWMLARHLKSLVQRGAVRLPPLPLIRTLHLNKWPERVEHYAAGRYEKEELPDCLKQLADIDEKRPMAYEELRPHLAACLKRHRTAGDGA